MMWPFNRKKPVDVQNPVSNPALKVAIHAFNSNKTEGNLQEVISEMGKANFLVLVNDKELIKSEPSKDGHVTLEQGSIIKFFLTHDDKGNGFFPLFTDWKEVDLWIKSKKNIFGWIMPTKEAFNFALGIQSAMGLVINPCTDRWTMTKEQIGNFLKEVK